MIRSALFAIPFASFWQNTKRFGLFFFILGRLQQWFWFPKIKELYGRPISPLYYALSHVQETNQCKQFQWPKQTNWLKKTTKYVASHISKIVHHLASAKQKSLCIYLKPNPRSDWYKHQADCNFTGHKGEFCLAVGALVNLQLGNFKKMKNFL